MLNNSLLAHTHPDGVVELNSNIKIAIGTSSKTLKNLIARLVSSSTLGHTLQR